MGFKDSKKRTEFYEECEKRNIPKEYYFGLWKSVAHLLHKEYCNGFNVGKRQTKKEKT